MPIPRALPFLLALLAGGCAPLQGMLYRTGLAHERARADLRWMTVNLGGRTVHYLEREGDGPAAEPLVLLHGFGGSKDHWVRFVRHLPGGYRVLAPDLPGHGDNARDTTVTYSISYLTDAVTAFLDRTSPGPVHLAGNSLGGRIAVEVALERPERIRSLALFDPAGVPSPEPSTLDSLLSEGENLLIPTTPSEYARFTALAFGDTPPSLPWPAEAVVARQYRRRAPFYRRVWDDLGAHFDLSRRLPALAVPTLLLWGEADEILDVTAADEWARLVPSIEVERWPGVGHAPMLERPEASAARYARFVAAH